MTTIKVKENEPFEVAMRRFKRTIEKPVCSPSCVPGNSTKNRRLNASASWPRQLSVLTNVCAANCFLRNFISQSQSKKRVKLPS